MDEIVLEILENGDCKLTSGRFSPAVHSTAENVFVAIAKMAGGDVKRVRKGTTHVHAHEKNEVHSHE